MKHTKLKDNLMPRVELSSLYAGDWFLCFDTHGFSTLSIKGDDTVHEGNKVICMNVMNGTLMRVNQTARVELIENVELIVT